MTLAAPHWSPPPSASSGAPRDPSRSPASPPGAPQPHRLTPCDTRPGAGHCRRSLLRSSIGYVPRSAPRYPKNLCRRRRRSKCRTTRRQRSSRPTDTSDRSLLVQHRSLHHIHDGFATTSDSARRPRHTNRNRQNPVLAQIPLMQLLRGQTEDFKREDKDQYANGSFSLLARTTYGR
jgi:hypothetical protein